MCVCTMYTMWQSVSTSSLLSNVPLAHIGHDTHTKTHFKNLEDSTYAVVYTNTHTPTQRCTGGWAGIADWVSMEVTHHHIDLPTQGGAPHTHNACVYAVLEHNSTNKHICTCRHTYRWTGCEKPNTHLDPLNHLQEQTGCTNTTGIK